MAKLAICVAGLPGAGKSLISEAARRLGFKVVVMGDAVGEEALKRGVPLSREGLGSLMLRLREELGPTAVAKLSLAKASGDAVVFEGVRSLAEVEFFKGFFDQVYVVAVYAPPRVRYERLRSRGRSDDPSTWEDFVERDLRELKVGLGDVIALADHLIVNTSTPAEAINQALSILKRLREGSPRG